MEHLTDDDVMEYNDTNDDIYLDNYESYYGRKNLGYLGYLDFHHGLSIDINMFQFNINKDRFKESMKNYEIEFETKLEIRKCCEDITCDNYEIDVYIDDWYVITTSNNSLYVLKNIKEYEELRLMKFNKLQVIVEGFIKQKYQKNCVNKIMLKTTLDINSLNNIMGFY